MAFGYVLIYWMMLLMQTITSDVVGVMDGDTIELRVVSSDSRAKNRRGKNLRIRFAHVDCPEKGFPYFQNAKKFTSEKCYRKTVKIVHNNEFDRYGRLIGEVILPDGKNLNQELVKAGLAIHYKKYSSSGIYSNLEIQAKLKKVGMWSK
jgi:micrococcal nuclease